MFSLLPWSSRLLSVLRIVSAYLFLLHGSAKLLGVPAIANRSTVALMSVSGVAGMFELVGGILLMLGLFTRPVAFVLSGEMAFAYFIGHASRGGALTPIVNGGDAAVLYCFVFLYIAVAGGGAWSLDALRRKGGNA